MKVITRRFGSHFGYTFRRNKVKLRLFLIIYIIITIISYLIISIRSHFIPLAFSMAESKAKAIGTIIINESVTSQLSAKGIDYNQLFEIQKNDEGEISAITANAARMNIIKSNLTEIIQDKINNVDTQQIGIPIGSMLNNELLAGRGPRIRIKLVTVGAIEIDFINSFISAGINQTKHEVQLQIKVTVSAMLPAGNTTADVLTAIPIAQTIIVGKVPDTYTNIQLPQQ